jgi:hypothetical protein|tara:strand:+ start:14700 stop:15017 length:318 start_codon:yes stop_codon:yes gene_type:complete
MKVQLNKAVELDKIPTELIKAIDAAIIEIEAGGHQAWNTRIILVDGEMTFALANLQYTINKVEESLRLLQETKNMLASYVEIINGNYTESKEHDIKQTDGESDHN